MMKQILSLVLAVLMLVSLSACAGETVPADTTPTGESTPTTQSSETTQPTAAPAISFRETVLVDNDICTFTIKSIENDPLWGYTMKAFLENKSGQTLMFSVEGASVNGFMCDPFWAAEVTPGMKANEDISFSESALAEIGVTDVTEISFTLHVYDSENYTGDYLVSEAFTLYPMGEEAVEPFVRTPAENEIVLFENENAAMIVTGQKDDPIWGYTLTVYLENRTDKNLMFSASDVSVNGFMCDPFWATEVAPGKRAITTISWLTDTLAESGITEVESITLPITVYDADDWMADYILEETFTVNPQF